MTSEDFAKAALALRHARETGVPVASVSAIRQSIRSSGPTTIRKSIDFF